MESCHLQIGHEKLTYSSLEAKIFIMSQFKIPFAQLSLATGKLGPRHILPNLRTLWTFAVLVPPSVFA